MFVPGADSVGRVLNLGNLAGDGINTSIVFEPGVGLVVIKTIPEAVMQAVKDYARDQRDIHKKGTMLGNTQRHWMPVSSLPAVMHNAWKQELGDPKDDPTAARKWRQRLNSSEFRDLRTSEHDI